MVSRIPHRARRICPQQPAQDDRQRNEPQLSEAEFEARRNAQLCDLLRWHAQRSADQGTASEGRTNG